MASSASPEANSAPEPPALGDSFVAEGSRGAVLNAAARVFAERGFVAPTVQDLLTAAAVSRRTFYKSFGNKHEVLDALHAAAIGLLLSAAVMASREARTPLEHVEHVLDAYLTNVRRGGRLLLVLQGEASREDSPLHARRALAFATLTKLIRDGVLEHLGRAVDPYVIHGALLGAEAIARRLIEEGDDDARATRVRASMLRLITATIFADDPTIAPLPELPRSPRPG